MKSMRSTAIALALLLAACGGSGGPPPIPNPGLSLNPALWTIGPIINGVDNSHNMPLNPTAEGAGWGFDFPAADGVHYITTGHGAISGTMTVTFTIKGTGTLVPSPGGGTSAPKLRLYFQRAGDDWSTNGYRWWSADLYSTLEDGTHTLTVPLTYDHWNSIYDHTGLTINDFQTSLNNTVNVGFTFGADFYGHGIYASPQPVHFTLNSFKIQ